MSNRTTVLLWPELISFILIKATTARICIRKYEASLWTSSVALRHTTGEKVGCLLEEDIQVDTVKVMLPSKLFLHFQAPSKSWSSTWRFLTVDRSQRYHVWEGQQPLSDRTACLLFSWSQQAYWNSTMRLSFFKTRMRTFRLNLDLDNFIDPLRSHILTTLLHTTVHEGACTQK